MKPNSPRLGPAPLLALVLVVGQGVEFSMIHHIDSYCSYASTEIWVVSSHLLMNVADALSYAVQYYIVQILIIEITNICIYILYTHRFSIFAQNDSPILAHLFLEWVEFIKYAPASSISRVMCIGTLRRIIVTVYLPTPVRVPVYQNPCHVFCLNRS